MSYYIYRADTGKCIGPVEKEEPSPASMYMPDRRNDWYQYLSTLPQIYVSEELKATWEDNQKVVEDVDFELCFWEGTAWWPVKHLVDRKRKPGTNYRIMPLPQPTTENQSPTHTSIEELISQLEDKNPYMGRQGNFDADRRSTGYKRAIIELRLLLSGKIITTPEAIADVWDASVRNWRYQTDCEYLKKQPDKATYLKQHFDIE